jgi:signal transduction histidine kinase/CheY-like chemotaxis protein
MVLLVVGVLLPQLAFCIVVVTQLAKYQKEASERRFIQAAHDMALAVDRELASTSHALQALSRSQNLEAGNMKAFYEEARRVRETQPAWTSVVLYQTDGSTVFSTYYPYGTTLEHVNDSDSLNRVVETRKPVVGSLVDRGPNTMLAFPVRVPIMFDGKLRYVLSATIEPPAMAEIVNGQRFGTDEFTRTLVDAHSTVVARTRSSQEYVGRQATASFTANIRAIEIGIYRDGAADGHPAYVAFSRAPISDWTAAVVVPTETIDGAARRSILGVVAAGVALLIISAAGAFVFSRRVSNQISAAAAAADTLAAGGYPDVAPSNVSEVERLSQALRSAADLLAQRDRERDESLANAQTARAQAEAANRTKDQFLAMLGHELRNPLGPIRNGAHLLTTLPSGHPELPGVLESIERQVVHMTRLIDDLLDTSRVARGKIVLQVQRLDVCSLLAQVASDFAHEFDNAAVTLSYQSPDYPVFVEADPTRLAQCVGNLLHNALKFTPSGGHVRLTLVAAVEEGAHVSVGDNGAGIDPALLPQLFEPFAQGPQALDRSQGGLGLGLALVKGLVEAHGGFVQAYSDGPGKGSVFTISLPVVGFEPIPAAPAPRIPEIERRRILVVEDMRDAARMLKLILSAAGHEVKIALTAGEALDIVQTFEPQVIVCDIGLPDMDGYALCRRFRQIPSLQSITLIALTGYGQSEDVVLAKEAGFDIHLTKPVDIPTLKSAIISLPSLTPDPEATPDPAPAAS